MSMASLQFYKNKYHYPHFSSTLTAYGPMIECTPVGMNLRSGSLHVKGDMTDFMNCNYLSFERDNQTVYGWIDDVRFRTSESFEVVYSVDAFRTYKSKIDLGVQYIDRRPQATANLDPLLGSDQSYMDLSTHSIDTVGTGSRVFVVQVRPAAGEIYSTTPLQPTPYQFFMVEYNPKQWTTSTPLQQLLTALEGGAETENLVTMYSIPWMNLNGLLQRSLPVTYAGGTTENIAGWYMLDNVADVGSRLTFTTPLHFNGINKDELLRVQHSVQLVIPEAGIIDIPDELMMRTDLGLRQDVDLMSGACNYMLVTADGPYTQSTRGSSVSSIPILSDPMDTYVSQNQNAMAVSLLGDVAMMAGSLAMFHPLGRAAGTALGLGAGMSTGAGVLGLYTGVNNMIDRQASIMDAGSKFSNPPAFLGSALGANFNGQVWVVIRRAPVDNAALVHENFGYPYGKVAPLVFPNSGYIKTEGCNVMTSNGGIPRWALQEINAIFDNGILVH